MRKILTVLLLAGIIWPCNNHKSGEHKNFNKPMEVDERLTATDEKLELNNGAKWKADSTTNNNVNNLKLILKKFDKASDKSLSAYKMAQRDLQEGIDKMIAECKMEGPNHLALHKWLEPLMGQVTELKTAGTVPGADKILNAINGQMSPLYPIF